jgi:uncharacterized protein (DUF488 family)
MSTVYTIGNSNLDWTRFAALLGASEITVLADVRSSPSSRLPHFSHAVLKARLEAAGISYVFMGVELGGRPKCGVPADYEQMAMSPLFITGLNRIEEVASRSRLAIMCSEHEPLECHRCLLVGRRLVERGVNVAHILRDGRIEPHPGTEDRLLKLTRQTENDLFASRSDRLARAYRDQNLRLWGSKSRAPGSRR